MAFEHNSLKNLFLIDTYCNGLFHRVMERDAPVPKFENRTLRKAWKNREMDLEHDLNDILSIIEFDEWDVGVRTERNILLYTGVSRDFQKKYGDVHKASGVAFCSDDDPDDLMMSLDLGGEGVTMHVDVCPTLGEEYPRVLRELVRKIPDDMDASCRYVLVVDECTVESCSWEDLVDIFDSHEIALVSFKEILS
jgi:hypothetical protein